MRNDNLNLWKLKHGKTFLSSFMKCAGYVYEGKTCKIGKSIKTFIELGLMEGIPMSIKNVNVRLHLTDKGISIHDQLLNLLKRGIIYQEKNGNLNWMNFQFA